MRKPPRLTARLAQSFCRAARGRRQAWRQAAAFSFEEAKEQLSADKLPLVAAFCPFRFAAEVHPAPPSAPASFILEEQLLIGRPRDEQGLVVALARGPGAHGTRARGGCARGGRGRARSMKPGQRWARMHFMNGFFRTFFLACQLGSARVLCCAGWGCVFERWGCGFGTLKVTFYSPALVACVPHASRELFAFPCDVYTTNVNDRVRPTKRIYRESTAACRVAQRTHRSAPNSFRGSRFREAQSN